MDMLGVGQPTPPTPEDLSTTVYRLHPMSGKQAISFTPQVFALVSISQSLTWKLGLTFPSLG